MIFTALAILVIAIPLVLLIQRDLRRAQFWNRMARKTRALQQRYVGLGVAAAKASRAFQEFGDALQNLGGKDEAVQVAATKMREAQAAVRAAKEAQDEALLRGATHAELYEAQRKKS